MQADDKECRAANAVGERARCRIARCLRRPAIVSPVNLMQKLKLLPQKFFEFDF
jgi:hypothetical protein